MSICARLSLASVVSAFTIPIALAVFGAASAAHDTADDAPWNPFGAVNGVEVFTRPFDGSSYPEVRASSTVCATLPELVAFVEDVSRFASWIPDTDEARLLAQPSPRAQIYYIRTAMPWPIRHRDMVYRLAESQDSSPTPDVVVSIEGVPEYIADYPGVVRMTAVTGQWTFHEDAGRTHIDLVMHIEPGGNIPAWLANRRIVGTPSKMLENLRRQFVSLCHDAP